MKKYTSLYALSLLAFSSTCFGGGDKPVNNLSSLGYWSYNIIGYTFDLSADNQAINILLLKHVDALSVKNLLIKLMLTGNKATTLSFDKNTEKVEGSLLVRSPENAFFLFGQKNELNDVREFIVKHLDIELVQKSLHPHIHNEQK